MFKLKSVLIVAVLVFLGAALPSAHASSASPPRMDPFDVAQQGLPSTIGGYTLFTVLTSDNMACVPAGNKIFVLQSTQPYAVEGSLSYSGAQDAAIKVDLDKRGLSASDKASWTIVGPGITRDQVISEIQDWSEQRRTFGCVTSGPAADGLDYQEFKEPPGTNYAGYTAFEDTDVGGRYSDVWEQEVYLESPATVGIPQNAVAFENNVKTNSNTLFTLQTGMDIWRNNPGGKLARIIWTDTNVGYVDQDMLISYLPSKTYHTAILYNEPGIPGYTWKMCVVGTWDPNHVYGCHSDPNALGSWIAGPSINTSVWFENQNTDPQWYLGFSSPFWAYGAQVDRWNGDNPLFLSWTTQDHHTEDHCAQNYDPHNALGGTLIGGYGGGWFLNHVPLVCP